METTEITLKRFTKKKSWMPWLPELSSDKLTLLNAVKAAKGKEEILIVDNETNILNLLYSILSKSYFPVLKSSPLDALQWLEEGNKPAVIITEFNHPHFNGLNFISYIKTSGIHTDLPIIILSELKNIEEILKATMFNVAAVVKKPFDPILLQVKIKSVIDEHKLAFAG